MRFDRAQEMMHALALLALTVVAGHIVDRTTGQPLTGVEISAKGGATVAPARTNDTGGYTLRGLTPGHYTLTVSSDDVPPQPFEVVVRGAKTQRFNMTACSTTLDYSCAAVTP
jgi:hypothetical protein